MSRRNDLSWGGYPPNCANRGPLFFRNVPLPFIFPPQPYPFLPKMGRPPPVRTLLVKALDRYAQDEKVSITFPSEIHSNRYFKKQTVAVHTSL